MILFLSHSLIVQSKKVIPIIEPVNLNSTVLKALPRLNSKGVSFVLIINPIVGNLVGKERNIYECMIKQLVDKEHVILGCYVNKKTKYSDIKKKLDFYKGYNFAIIHIADALTEKNLKDIKSKENRIKYNIFLEGKVSDSYQKLFEKRTRVLLQDQFVKRKRNVDYPGNELFSNLFSRYKENYFGFGDFQMVGEKIGRGGPAHAVALHLTYLKEKKEEEIYIKHFISDDTETTENVQGKYLQALGKLVQFLEGYNNTPETVGIKEYRKNLKEGLYHGLGYPKKVSIKHHIEMMTQLI